MNNMTEDKAKKLARKYASENPGKVFYVIYEPDLDKPMCYWFELATQYELDTFYRYVPDSDIIAAYLY